jgi:hypothetical protein
LVGLPTGTSLDFGATYRPGSFDNGTWRDSRLAITVVRLKGSTSNTKPPLASLTVIVALRGPPTSSIPKPSCGPAERGDVSTVASRSSLCERFTTCGLSSVAAIASVVQNCEFFRQSPAPAPRQSAIPHRPANPIRCVRAGTPNLPTFDDADDQRWYSRARSRQSPVRCSGTDMVPSPKTSVPDGPPSRMEKSVGSALVPAPAFTQSRAIAGAREWRTQAGGHLPMGRVRARKGKR